MYKLHGFFTQNSLKPLYVLEELGVDYEYCFINLMKLENRTDEFRAMSASGKVPVWNTMVNSCLNPARSAATLRAWKNPRCFPRTSCSVPGLISG